MLSTFYISISCYLAFHFHYSLAFSPVFKSQSLRALGLFDHLEAVRASRRTFNKYQTAKNILEGIGVCHECDLAPLLDVNSFPSPDSDQQSFRGGTIPPISLSVNSWNLTAYKNQYMDLLYFGDAQFGSNQQRLTLDIDTGSADLWIPSNCADCAGNQFDSKSSSSCITTSRPFSAEGEVSGTTIVDQVYVAGLLVPEQTFGAVSVQTADFYDYPSNGLLGMAFGTIASCRRPTLFENLWKLGLVDEPMFSVHLTRNGATGSEVCLGCYDSAKAIGGKIFWIPVISRTYWSINMTGIVAGNLKKVYRKSIPAAIDTGTSLIYLPEAATRQFYAMIPGAQPWSADPSFHVFPCDFEGPVKLSFGGMDFDLSMNDFNLGLTGEGEITCVGGIIHLETAKGLGEIAIIGDEFLKQWYSTYSYADGGKVGFSRSINSQIMA